MPNLVPWRRGALLSALAIPAIAWAHHGWSGYDSNAPLKVVGTIQASGYEHPHGYVKLEAPGKTWLVVPAGLMMVTAHATEFATNPAFQLKLALLAAAGANVAFFHAGPYRGVRAWDASGPAPAAACASAALSMAIWIAVISCGRLIAYF